MVSQNHVVAIVGVGAIAAEYARVFAHLGVEYSFFTRNPASANIARNGIDPTNVFELTRLDAAKFGAIVIAVSVEALATTLERVLSLGFKRVLIEKPGSLTLSALTAGVAEQRQHMADVRVAYNRRFYQSVRFAQEMVMYDGGLTSIHFDFSEVLGVDPGKTWPQQVLERWVLANSSHVIDLAFFLSGGLPASMNCSMHGNHEVHPGGDFFSGDGITLSGVPFTYRSDWRSMGRWGVFLYTRDRLISLSPLEDLRVKTTNFGLDRQIDFDKTKDTVYKPGFLSMAESFLDISKSRTLPTLAEQVRLAEVVSKMANYEG